MAHGVVILDAGGSVGLLDPADQADRGDDQADWSMEQFRFGQDRWAERFASVASLCAPLEQRPSFKATVLQG